MKLSTRSPAGSIRSLCRRAIPSPTIFVLDKVLRNRATRPYASRVASIDRGLSLPFGQPAQAGKLFQTPIVGGDERG
jgi:hypothetical protein